MDDDFRESVEEWIEFLGPRLVASLPNYAEVRDALRAGDWERADDAIFGTTFARTADGLSLRGLLADVRGDRGTLGEIAKSLEFRERPRVKLWALRETGRTAEAAALVRGAWSEYRRDAGVLREGLASAWIENDWSLFIALSEALEVLSVLDAEGWAARGWALEKRRRVPEAVSAYVHAYRAEPSVWLSKRLVRIVMDRDHWDVEATIYAFAAEEDAERSDDPWMQILAIGDHFHHDRNRLGVRLGLRLTGRMIRGFVRRRLAATGSRLRRGTPDPQPGRD